MGFLDDEDFEEIRQIINETVETFAQKPIKYNLSVEYSLQRMGRDLNNANLPAEYDLLGLVVWEAKDSEIEIEELGKYDFSMGFVLFSWDYLASEGLIVETGGYVIPITEPEKDTIIIDGKTVEVMGVWTGGQLKDTDSIVKIFFKRNLPNG